MILAKNVIAYTNDGKAYSITAYTEVQNIRAATDKGFWFDAQMSSFGHKQWRRVWSAEVPTLRD
jgi:hypothetical protein